MHSSTSSSDPAAHGDYWVKPLPERRVPQVAWPKAAVVALMLFVCAMSAWEWRMRSLELRAGDLGPARGAWAVERRRIDSEEVPLAIVGTSRILFGTDLDVLTEVAGVRPVQLALQGSSPRMYLADIAANPNFKGLLIIDATPPAFFRFGGGLFDDTLEFFRNQSLSQRSDHWLEQHLQRHLAYLDTDYRLRRLVEREIRLPERKGVAGPYFTPWKFAETFEQRQTFTWGRLERDERLRQHAIDLWRANEGRLPDDNSKDIEASIADARRSVEAIRARGGDVVFVRPPSTGELIRIEEAKFPRAQAWDRLLAETKSVGFHYADYATTRDLVCVEESHLSRADAAVFTRAYAEFVRAAIEKRREQR